MSSAPTAPLSQADPNSATADASQSGSKFKRFLKKFGRRPSDDVGGAHNEGLIAESQSAQNGSARPTNGGEGLSNGHRSSGTTPSGTPLESSVSDYKGTEKGTGRSRRGSAKGETVSRQGTPKARRSFFGNSGNTSAQASAAPTPVLPQLHSSSVAGPTAQNKSASNPVSPAAALGLGFDSARAPDLAGTLQIPTNDGSSSPPPQIEGLPTLEALKPADVITTAPGGSGAALPLDTTQHRAQTDSKPVETLVPANAGVIDVTDSSAHASGTTAVNTHPVDAASAAKVVDEREVSAPMHVPYAGGEGPSAQGATTAASVDESSSASGYEPSLSGRTTDTGKQSRASTKPTTLMSFEGREGAAPSLAGIATYRHGDAAPAASGVASATPVISFVDPSISVPGANEPASSEPYISVPALSRPHPSNNPTPGGVPPDNASVLTLASSTAAASIGAGTGYAASSRHGHGHVHAPSLGGARSIGGSLMGERRNSSDTYASVKALPPQSRRGSDSSMRTGKESIPASATGLNSANAMLVGGPTSSSASFRDGHVQGSPLVAASAGPGAPGDRISMQRTSSQRTIATQLSIPLSTSVGASAGLAAATSSGSSTSNAASTTVGNAEGPITPHATTSSASNEHKAVNAAEQTATAAGGHNDGVGGSALTAAAAAAAGAVGTVAATASSLLPGTDAGSASEAKDDGQLGSAQGEPRGEVQSAPTAAFTFAQENGAESVRRTVEDADGRVQAHADSLAAEQTSQ